jgi:hypothetical protein
MDPSQNDRQPMAVALEWVSRITTVAFEMVLPGVGGWLLDGALGTFFFFSLIGFGVGLAGGMWHLIVMANRSSQNRDDKK